MRADETLTFADFAVIVPAASAPVYLPLAQAVFEAASRLPHTIVDLPRPAERRILDVVGLLLELPLGSLGRPDLLRVAMHPAVARRFPEVDPEDWLALCEALEIVRGADRADQAESYLTRDRTSWEQGLRRLALGAFLSGPRSGEERPFVLDGEKVLPFDLPPGLEPAARALGIIARELIAFARRGARRPGAVRDPRGAAAAHDRPDDLPRARRRGGGARRRAPRAGRHRGVRARRPGGELPRRGRAGEGAPRRDAAAAPLARGGHRRVVRPDARAAVPDDLRRRPRRARLPRARWGTGARSSFRSAAARRRQRRASRTSTCSWRRCWRRASGSPCRTWRATRSPASRGPRRRSSRRCSSWPSRTAPGSERQRRRQAAPSEILRARPPLARHEDPAACAVIPAAARERRAAALGASLRRAGGGVRQLPRARASCAARSGPTPGPASPPISTGSRPPPAVAATRARRGLTLFDLRRFLECPLQASARVLLPVGDDSRRDGRGRGGAARARAARRGARGDDPVSSQRADRPAGRARSQRRRPTQLDRTRTIARPLIKTLEGKLPDGLFGRAHARASPGPPPLLARRPPSGDRRPADRAGAALARRRARAPPRRRDSPRPRRPARGRRFRRHRWTHGAAVPVPPTSRASSLSLASSTSQDKLERDLLGPFLTHLALAALGDDGASRPTRAIVIRPEKDGTPLRRGAPLLADLRRRCARLPGTAGLRAAARGARLFSPLRGGLLLEGPLRQRRDGRGAPVDPAPARRQLDPLRLRSRADPRPPRLPRPAGSRGPRDRRPALRPLLRGVRAPEILRPRRSGDEHPDDDPLSLPRRAGPDRARSVGGHRGVGRDRQDVLDRAPGRRSVGPRRRPARRDAGRDVHRPGGVRAPPPHRRAHQEGRDDARIDGERRRRSGRSTTRRARDWPPPRAPSTARRSRRSTPFASGCSPSRPSPAGVCSSSRASRAARRSRPPSPRSCARSWPSTTRRLPISRPISPAAEAPRRWTAWRRCSTGRISFARSGERRSIPNASPPPRRPSRASRRPSWMRARPGCTGRRPRR